jgi:hypothetical protein
MGKFLVRFSSFSVAFLAASGCDDSTTLVLLPNPAVRVVIDNSRCPEIQRCGTCVLETDAFDKNSKPAQFPTLIWSSQSPSIATVAGIQDGEGRVTGWTIGTTTIAVEVLETGASDEVGVRVVSSMINCIPPATGQASVARR